MLRVYVLVLFLFFCFCVGITRSYLEFSNDDEGELVYVGGVDYRRSLSGVNGTIASGQSSQKGLAHQSLHSTVQPQTIAGVVNGSVSFNRSKVIESEVKDNRLKPTVGVEPSSQLPAQSKPTVKVQPPSDQLPHMKPIVKLPTQSPNTKPTAKLSIPSPIPTMKIPSPTQLDKAFNLVVQGQSDSSNQVIYFTPNQYGGFSNGFRAIRSLALYSILYGYKLRVDWLQFFEVMNDSMRVLSSPVNKQCRYIPTFDVAFGANGLQVWGCIWTDDIADVTEKMMKYPENGKKLVRLGLFDSVPTFDEVAHFTSLLLFRLNTVLHSQADEAFSRFPHPLLGLQVRMGGSSANTHEQVVFCTLDEVDYILSYVDSFVKKNQIVNVVLFLSTDSDEMARAIREKSKYPVVSLNAYTIGHSSPMRNRDWKTQPSSMKRALMDMYLLSKCDYLITTWRSSFGRSAHYLSSSTRKELMKLAFG